MKPIDKTHGETKLYQKHIPSAFFIYIISHVDGFSMDLITYVGENAAEVFVEKIEEVTEYTYEKFNVSVPMIFDKVCEGLSHLFSHYCH